MYVMYVQVNYISGYCILFLLRTTSATASVTVRLTVRHLAIALPLDVISAGLPNVTETLTQNSKKIKQYLPYNYCVDY